MPLSWIQMRTWFFFGSAQILTQATVPSHGDAFVCGGRAWVRAASPDVSDYGMASVSEDVAEDDWNDTGLRRSGGELTGEELKSGCEEQGATEHQLAGKAALLLFRLRDCSRVSWIRLIFLQQRNWAG
jgi:hypothetical protein